MDVEKMLSDFYSGYDEDGRLRSRHGMVEFLTTMRYVERYLKPGMRILEIGGHRTVFPCPGPAGLAGGRCGTGRTQYPGV